MCVTWNAIYALLQSDWSAQHTGLGHEDLSRRIFPRNDSPRLLVIRACGHVGNNYKADPRESERSDAEIAM